jgi:hypothetical protein
MKLEADGAAPGATIAISSRLADAETSNVCITYRNLSQ